MKDPVISDETSGGLARWAPLAVVLMVAGGFVALSWYAYHAGMQSVKDEDLLVVEADKTPMKEKPADPGGMQFPNQDKTIFDTFSGNPHPTPKVERVLPLPEEPMPKDADASDTSTWVNDKLHSGSAKDEKKEPAGSEQIIEATTKPGDETVAEKKPAKVQIPAAQDTSHIPEHQVIAAMPAAPTNDDSETYIAKKESVKTMKALDKAVKAAESPVAKQKDTAKQEDAEDLEDKVDASSVAAADAKPDEKVSAKVADKPADKKLPGTKTEAKKDVVKYDPPPAAKPAASTGKYMVQLGAYRSEDEAMDAWNKMHLRQIELSDRDPLVVKADLGDKGIYYRLRLGGFASTADAKSFCSKLSAKKQPCILPTDK